MPISKETIRDISEFKNNYYPAPVNRFLAHVKRGKVLSASKDETMMFRCESADLPGRGFATSNQLIYGPVRRIPYNSTYIDTTLVFQVSQNYMEEKRWFDEWQDAMQDPDSFDIGYYDDLIGEVTVYVYNERNQGLYTVIMEEAYPLTVTGISVGWGNRDEAMKLSVTIAYRKWKRTSDVDSLAQSIITTDTMAINATGPELFDNTG